VVTEPDGATLADRPYGRHSSIACPESNVKRRLNEQAQFRDPLTQGGVERDRPRRRTRISSQLRELGSDAAIDYVAQPAQRPELGYGSFGTGASSPTDRMSYLVQSTVSDPAHKTAN